MLLQSLLLLLGLVLLLAGGESLVRGASALARRLGLSEVLIGLTVVAFGTSAPELVVCLSAALGGSAAIAFGNAVGSNVANLGLLLGATAVLSPLRVQSSLITREIPFLVAASVALLALGADAVFGIGADALTRGDGIVLLVFFGIFLFANARDVLVSRGDSMVKEAVELTVTTVRPALTGAVVMVLLGLVGLVIGGQLAVSAASDIARALGVGEVVIAATVVAVGTSLPELVTCLLAARRGAHDLAVGNIVGSNLFNVLFVLASTAVVSPVPLPPGGWIDLLISLVLALILLPMAATQGRRITRGEGLIFLAAYGGYLVFQLVR